MFIPRLLPLSLARSFFLFGARGTGKSTLLKERLPGAKTLWIDLLDPETEHRLAFRPGILNELITAAIRETPKLEWVVIDEIQKVPELLGIVHQWIRGKKLKFALTGSSARKLKRAGADMLAGRASWFELFPLSSLELKAGFNLLDGLAWGGLPEPIGLPSEERKRFLRSYCQTYLKEEVIQEQLIRKIQPFRNFIELAAIQNGSIVNYAKFGRDVGVDTITIQAYYGILVDTLLGFELPAFHESVRKRQRTNPKFYFFDLGVTRALAGLLESPPVPRTDPYGRAFEHFFINHAVQTARTLEKDWRFSYLKTADQAEIDLIADLSPRKRLLFEIKSSDRIDETRVSLFSRLSSAIEHTEKYFVSNDPMPRALHGVTCLHWTEALRRLFLR